VRRPVSGLRLTGQLGLAGGVEAYLARLDWKSYVATTRRRKLSVIKSGFYIHRLPQSLKNQYMQANRL
jgi:hypothetical protein